LKKNVDGVAGGKKWRAEKDGRGYAGASGGVVEDVREKYKQLTPNRNGIDHYEYGPVSDEHSKSQPQKEGNPGCTGKTVRAIKGPKKNVKPVNNREGGKNRKDHYHLASSKRNHYEKKKKTKGEKREKCCQREKKCLATDGPRGGR